LQINHRNILTGILETCKLENQEKKILVIIDKLDKIGWEGVKQELQKANIESQKLIDFFSFEGDTKSKLDFLNKSIVTETGKKGIKDLEYFFNQSAIANLQSKISFDFTLARGLDYYTGIIFEARAPEKVKIGSIGGGGRYDDLTGLFGVPDIPGVGISFGVDRIYDVMEELDIFPKEIAVTTQVLFFNTDEKSAATAFDLAEQLRSKGISAEIYHEAAKPDKQFKYAEKKNIPYVVRELKDGMATVKNILTGKQEMVPASGLVDWLTS
jgi:histidyl-tRNA synthetase